MPARSGAGIGGNRIADMPALTVLHCLIVLFILGPIGHPVAAEPDAEPIAALYPRAEVFRAAIATAEALDLDGRQVSGLTVPHHLVAADLIARAFAVAAGNRYDKIVLLSPDHFKRSRLPFTTTRRDFDTVLGVVPSAVEDVERLAATHLVAEDSSVLEKEHGVAAVLPFIRHYFPNTPVIAITVAIGSTVAEWEQFVVDIAPLITSRTLIVQSTDFSHYLPLAAAIRRDQEVLNLLSAGDIQGIAALNQPQHIDSRGSQYIQMRLQSEHFGTGPTVIANANMEEYTGRTETETTSYIVQIYPAPADAPAIDLAGYVDGEVVCFAGDTFFGRFVAPLLSREEVRADLLQAATSILKGCPLIVNLEGVMVPELPTGLGPVTLAMPKALTLAWIDVLNISAVSLANNHSNDLGPTAYADMAMALRGAGIVVVEPGQTVDLGPLRLIGLSDLSNTERPARERITDDDMDVIMLSEARPPLAAFVHWGTEFVGSPGPRELHLADLLRRAAVSLAVGAHPHVAGNGMAALAGGEMLLVYSLGNFLFDQPGGTSSGAVLEVRFFPQGTFFARLIPIPNLYDSALAARPAVDLGR